MSLARMSTGQFAINSVSKEHTNEKLNKVLDYVHFHFSEVIRLADVAKMVNMSEASFCRFIKQHTSKSFIDFLTDIRLGAASWEVAFAEVDEVYEISFFLIGEQSHSDAVIQVGE